MPCLNEERTVGTCIEKAQSSFKKNPASYEIIIADNGSTDNSIKIAKKAGAKVVHVDRKGYGAALQGGIEQASGKYIIIGDCDDSYDFTKIYSFIDKLRQGNDLVMGNRFAGGIMPGSMPLLHKFLGNPLFSFIGRLFFRSKVGDFCCGLRGFTKEAWRKLDLQTTGMEYAIEMIVKATAQGMKIDETPIILHKDGRIRSPHLQTWSDGWKHLRFMLLFAPTWLFLLPGLLLFIFGGLFFVLAAPHAFTVLGIRLDVHTLLVSSVLMIIGIQTIILGFFTKLFIYKFSLLPSKKVQQPFLMKVNLNYIFLISVSLIILGVIILGRAVFLWYLQRFGNLDYSYTMRIVIPSLFLIQLGVQLFFNSFFLGVLLLPRKS